MSERDRCGWEFRDLDGRDRVNDESDPDGGCRRRQRELPVTGRELGEGALLVVEGGLTRVVDVEWLKRCEEDTQSGEDEEEIHTLPDD